jgi:hypothetical protein
MFDRPINTERFLAWAQRAVVRTLRPGEIVIKDNLCANKNPVIHKAR